MPLKGSVLGVPQRCLDGKAVFLEIGWVCAKVANHEPSDWSISVLAAIQAGLFFWRHLGWLWCTGVEECQRPVVF